MPQKSLKVITAYLSGSTVKQYDSYLKQWWIFCNNQKIDPLQPKLKDVVLALTEFFEKGAGYSSVNTYKCALSVIAPEVTKDITITRFLKGVFKLRPPLPKYPVVWDPTIVLDYFKLLGNNKDLPLLILSHKLVTLLALTTGHRIQTLALISVDNISKLQHKYIVRIPNTIKTSKPGSKNPMLHLPFFNEIPEICPARTLEEYLNRTKSIRKRTIKLLISYRKPHEPISGQTISRWIRTTLMESGIDTSIFSSHSTRHASTSAAFKSGVNIQIIRKAAGWSEGSNTFFKFYNRKMFSDSTNLFANQICNLAI